MANEPKVSGFTRNDLDTLHHAISALHNPNPQDWDLLEIAKDLGAISAKVARLIEAACSQPVAPGPEVLSALKGLLAAAKGLHYSETFQEWDGSGEYAAIAKAGIVAEAAIQQIEAAPPAVSTPRPEPTWPSLDSESGDFTDGWNQAIDLCRKAFGKWTGAVSTPRCPTLDEWLKLGQSLTNLYICNRELPPMLQDSRAADFLRRELAQFFHPGSQPSHRVTKS